MLVPSTEGLALRSWMRTEDLTVLFSNEFAIMFAMCGE